MEKSEYSLDIPQYEMAERIEFKFKDHLKFAWKHLKITFVILLLLVPELFKGIFRLIVPLKPKCIKGKVALITGGAMGLGKSIAFELAKEGCNLAICDIDLHNAQRTSSEIEEKFKTIRAVAFEIDVSDQQKVQLLKSKIESKIGPVDILINNAGLLCANISLREGSAEDIQRIINVNLTSHFWVSEQFSHSVK
jgi:hypothetical protein